MLFVFVLNGLGFGSIKKPWLWFKIGLWRLSPAYSASLVQNWHGPVLFL